MKSSSPIPEIKKEAFSKAREKLGLQTKELAIKACLSARQIEQIESGETNSFYGVQNKFTAAKKVATLLNLKDEEAFKYSKLINTIDDLPAAIAPPNLMGDKHNSSQKKSIEVVDEVKHENIVPQMKLDSEILTASKNSTQKRFIIFFGVIALAALAIVALRPLYFPEKPAETPSIQENAVLEDTSPPSQVSDSPAIISESSQLPGSGGMAVVANPPEGCPPIEANPSTYTPDVAYKASNMVYVQAKSRQMVCVIDASGKSQNKMLEPGVGAAFYGSSPFKVLTSGLTQVDIFFQGAKVRPRNLEVKTIVLQPISFTPASE